MEQTKNRQHIIAKALKIRELAIRGVDGERDAAKRMFENYCKANNLTEAELNVGETMNTRVNLRYKNMSFEEIMKDLVAELRKNPKTAKYALLVGLGGLILGGLLSYDGYKQRKANGSKK